MEWQISTVEFQRFGNVWIRIDKIAAVCFTLGPSRDLLVDIHLVANDGLVLTGKTADAFRDWWDSLCTQKEE